jgi:hypothetical protein
MHRAVRQYSGRQTEALPLAGGVPTAITSSMDWRTYLSSAAS